MFLLIISKITDMKKIGDIVSEGYGADVYEDEGKVVVEWDESGFSEELSGDFIRRFEYSDIDSMMASLKEGFYFRREGDRGSWDPPYIVQKLRRQK